MQSLHGRHLRKSVFFTALFQQSSSLEANLLSHHQPPVVHAATRRSFLAFFGDIVHFTQVSLKQLCTIEVSIETQRDLASQP